MMVPVIVGGGLRVRVVLVDGVPGVVGKVLVGTTARVPGVPVVVIDNPGVLRASAVCVKRSPTKSFEVGNGDTNRLVGRAVGVFPDTWE